MTKTLRLLAGLSCAMGLFAQSDANKGQIVGTVFDQKQAVIPGAKVHIVDTGTGAVRDLTTGGSGEFRAVLLDPGQYDVTVSASGFADSVYKGLVISVGTAVNMPVILTLGTTTQTVEVSGTLSTVD